MGIKFKSTFNANRHISQIKARNRARLGPALQDAKTQIQYRTEKGIAPEGGGFRRYSKSYEAWKVRKFGPTRAKPNLFLSGDMLAAMQTELVDLGDVLRGRIYFLSDQVKKAIWNQQTRKFFALSREQLQTIKRKLRGQ